MNVAGLNMCQDDAKVTSTPRNWATRGGVSIREKLCQSGSI